MRVTISELEQSMARRLVTKYNQQLARAGAVEHQVDFDRLEPSVKLLVTQALCEGYRHYMANGRNRN